MIGLGRLVQVEETVEEECQLEPKIIIKNIERKA
jgi:hypothetical protein